MKKLLTILCVMLCIACSKEDNNDINLDGNYISDEVGINELFLLSIHGKSGTWSSYNTGKLLKEESITWSATKTEITIDNGKSVTYPLQVKEDGILIGEITYRKAPGNNFQDIVGHTYVAADRTPSDKRNIYISYTFNPDGTISVSENYDRIGGELHLTRKGKYTIKGASLSLKIESITSYDEYTVENLSNDKKSFSYNIFDTSIGKSRTLFFYATR